jgi:serine/threonine protein phosphatase 1
MTKDYFIVGDVHGCFNTLQGLLENWEPEKQQLIFVGDIVDHGNFSAQVGDFLHQLQSKHKDTIILRGNHEHQFINHCLTEFNEDWYSKSGERTFEQYLALGRNIENDATWMKNFPIFYETPTLLVTHAGLPHDSLPFEPDNREGVVWHRNPILKLEKLQVFGHTPQENAVYDVDINGINIDTGAYKGNFLTAIKVSKNAEILDLISHQTHELDLVDQEYFL